MNTPHCEACPRAQFHRKVARDRADLVDFVYGVRDGIDGRAAMEIAAQRDAMRRDLARYQVTEDGR